MADYVKMWEDLGMDINNHDNLCQVLSNSSWGCIYDTGEPTKSNGFLGYGHC